MKKIDSASEKYETSGLDMRDTLDWYANSGVAMPLIPETAFAYPIENQDLIELSETEMGGLLALFPENAWRILKLAEYSLSEIVKLMRNGHWLDYETEISNNPNLYSVEGPWTRLFHYCGFEIDELRTVGFRATVTKEQETELRKTRDSIRWHVS